VTKWCLFHLFVQCPCSLLTSCHHYQFVYDDNDGDGDGDGDGDQCSEVNISVYVLEGLHYTSWTSGVPLW